MSALFFRKIEKTDLEDVFVLLNQLKEKDVDSLDKDSSWKNFTSNTSANSIVGIYEDKIVAYGSIVIENKIRGDIAGHIEDIVVDTSVRGKMVGVKLVKELVDNNRRKVFFKEIAISVLNGILFAIITGFAAWIWFSDISLSIIVGAAMVINILSAGLFGFLIPYIFNKVKIDPALASSVFVTTITDVFGFLSFLGLASIYLF